MRNRTRSVVVVAVTLLLTIASAAQASPVALATRVAPQAAPQAALQAALQQTPADSSQSPSSSGVDIGDTLVSDIVALGADALLLYGAPARWTTRDWAIAGGATALGLGAMSVDDDVREVALRNQGVDGDAIAETANWFGTWTPALAISGGLYVTGLAFDWPVIRMAGRHVGQSVLYAGLLTTTIKVVAGRQRPLFDGGPFVFDPFTSDDSNHSFISGHATLVFAIASSLSADIDHPAATVGLYGLASITGLSRIYTDRHWVSDVILGAAVGTACGYGVSHLHDALDTSGSSLLIVPGVDRLTMVWTF
jgi:membrane-associated phospholipid phosphatase